MDTTKAVSRICHRSINVSASRLFTHYYLAYPLCSPSRAAILTGTFPHNHGVTTNSNLNHSAAGLPFHPIQEESLINVWLQSAGYHTMLCGKVSGFARHRQPSASI